MLDAFLSLKFFCHVTVLRLKSPLTGLTGSKFRQFTHLEKPTAAAAAAALVVVEKAVGPGFQVLFDTSCFSLTQLTASSFFHSTLFLTHVQSFK